MSKPITLHEASRQIVSGQLDPVELTEQCLRQIRRWDDRVHAWVLVDEQSALNTARQMADEAARKEFRGPLHGVPLGIKDIVDVEGLPTRAGSPLRADHVARCDAPITAAQRKAAAIILGKTVTVEFACFDPSPSRNPWDPKLGHSPGGSSSGSAVALALGMCLGAIGTQTGGSLVRPASYCGVAACKPTFGRVDRRGVLPVSYHLDHPGPMARSVRDLAVMLDCLPISADFGPPSDGAESDSMELPPRLALVEGYFMETADPPVREVVQKAIDTLAASGASIEPVSLPVDFVAMQAMHTRIMAVEAAAYHCPWFPAHRASYGVKIAELLDEGRATSAVDYAAALAELREFRDLAPSLFGQFDAFIMPATDTTAPPTLDTTGDKRFQAPWSCAGLPVVSLPCGLASTAMPAAVQLVGRYHDDARLLRIGQWCEDTLAFDAAPALL